MSRLKTNKNFLLAIVIILQMLFFITWSLIEESKQSNPNAKTILLETVPIDPRDYLSGNYFTLSYAISNIGSFHKYDKMRSGTIFAILKEQGKYYVPDYISSNKPEKIRNDQVIIKGQSDVWHINYGIEKYFINQNTKTPNRTDKVDVLVNIDKNSSPRIVKLYVNGQEFQQ